MRRVCRCCLLSLLKLVNSIIGILGIAMILYSLWMLKSSWEIITHNSITSLAHGIHDDGYQFILLLNPFNGSAPWFIYACLGMGISMCLITCTGHVAAETANRHCLVCYMVLVFLVILLEGSIAAGIGFDRNWERDFPFDPTGRFDEFKEFVRTNFELCKWIASFVVAAQVLSLVLALVLRALGPDGERDDDSDDDSVVTTRLPLLKDSTQQSSSLVHSQFHPLRSESWNKKTQDKVPVTQMHSIDA